MAQKSKEFALTTPDELGKGFHMLRIQPVRHLKFKTCFKFKSKDCSGDLRFSPPKSIEPWNGIRDATRDPVSCPQVPSPIDRPIFAATTETSEDCLVLNVEIPGPGRHWSEGVRFKKNTF